MSCLAEGFLGTLSLKIQETLLKLCISQEQ